MPAGPEQRVFRPWPDFALRENLSRSEVQQAPGRLAEETGPLDEVEELHGQYAQSPRHYAAAALAGAAVLGGLYVMHRLRK